jgi:hypothetical protein
MLGQLHILLHAYAVFIKRCEVILRVAVAVLGRAARPVDGA